MDETQDEKVRRLLKEYRAAVRHFSWTVDQLPSKLGSVDADAFTTALKVVDEAQGVCEKARRAIDES